MYCHALLWLTFWVLDGMKKYILEFINPGELYRLFAKAAGQRRYCVCKSEFGIRNLGWCRLTHWNKTQVHPWPTWSPELVPVSKRKIKMCVCYREHITPLLSYCNCKVWVGKHHFLWSYALDVIWNLNSQLELLRRWLCFCRLFLGLVLTYLCCLCSKHHIPGLWVHFLKDLCYTYISCVTWLYLHNHGHQIPL